ncbi:uncharacterized protein [Zea mays]|uniref:uncharacterized protein n=1 Tax=Zea mays TaxID=4577 RepID=UPI0009A9AB94|nr:uncharacterized protein LOC103637251 [Zea mays]|eukprot:XP_020398695.1 uncharacterized protein LOC103637251 [Zea mays]
MLVFSDHVRSFVNPVWTSSGRPVDRKRTGPRPCPVCYLPVEQALALRPAKPSLSPVLQSLNYVLEDILIPKESKSGSLFGGFASLEERDKSYDIKDSMTVHCGFVRGKVPGLNTGFDIDEADHSEMQLCQSTVVASAIFGNYDVMQQPKNISKFSKDTVCFFMFLDELIELVGRKQFNSPLPKGAKILSGIVDRELKFFVPGTRHAQARGKPGPARRPACPCQPGTVPVPCLGCHVGPWCRHEPGPRKPRHGAGPLSRNKASRKEYACRVRNPSIPFSVSASPSPLLSSS